MREVFRMLLESQDDMTVLGEANNGAEATRMTAELHPDVVLMDVRMPGMDGLEATRAIRASDGPCAGVPILAVTADVMRDDVERCRTAGMNGHVPKPINPARLMTALMAVLDGGEAFPEGPAQPRVAVAA